MIPLANLGQKDKEMFEMKERMAAMKESLRQREAELNTIMAADKGEGARNVGFVEGLQNDTKETEAAIEDHGEDGHDVFSGLKTALETRRKEVIEYKTRSERAEARAQKKYMKTPPGFSRFSAAKIKTNRGGFVEAVIPKTVRFVANVFIFYLLERIHSRVVPQVLKRRDAPECVHHRLILKRETYLILNPPR